MAPTDDGLCEWCGDLNNGSTYYPYCSEACEDAAEAGNAFMALIRPGDLLERYGDAIYVTEPAPERPKGRRFHAVLTVARSQPDNVERVVAVERFDPAKHDQH
jgi:hypothetical protein